MMPLNPGMSVAGNVNGALLTLAGGNGAGTGRQPRIGHGMCYQSNDRGC